MLTGACWVCGKQYDESRCPYCYKRYMAGEMPFSKIPEELMPFYDYGLCKIDWPFEMWQACEKICRETGEELKKTAMRARSRVEREEFRAKIEEESRERIRGVIKQYLPELQGAQNCYNSTGDDFENYKIKF